MAPFLSSNCNRLLANIGSEGDHLARRRNLERFDGRRTNGLGNGVRETLVYRSENRDCDNVNSCLNLNILCIQDVR
jgi:hypothetical protein